MSQKLCSNILVVDDQANWRELLVEILEKDGYTVKTASSFQEAKRLLENEIFDLVTIDMRLEDASVYNVDGMAVLKEAKAKHPCMKMIVLTGYVNPEQKAKALEYYHADGYYEKAPDGKPFDIDQFSNAISKLLEA